MEFTKAGRGRRPGVSRRRPGTMAAAGILAMLAALVLGGCAPQLNRIETGVQDNRDAMSRLQAENKRLAQEVEALAALLRMDKEAGNETSAMRLAKLSQVSARMDQLLQKLDDNAEYMRELSARVDLLATRQGVPALSTYKPVDQPAADTEVLPEEGRSIMAQAELDRSRGNTELAQEGYEEFLANYGDAEAADEATYWLGDLAYGADRHEAALARFEELLAKWPRSPRAPAALYKGRACLMALGRTNEAWEWGGRLLSQFPESDEAALLSTVEEGN
ncbi:hypothetical protein KDM41_16730 [bacterium]|nr:hypothetical protein [bacterium]